MRIALDAMGGDFAPQATVHGAVLAAKSTGHEIILVGIEDLIKEELSKYNITNLPLKICPASECIEMDDHPAQSVRQKKDSSLSVAAKLVADKRADAFVSAGNSGAAMTAALLYLGRIPNVSRPAIAAVFPTAKGISAIVDVGANVDCKAKHLFQFALMGTTYIKTTCGIENPRVALLSIGKEDTKGNELTLSTFELLKKSDLNFIGNIEGRELMMGGTDVIVCDGFTGNIVLKLGEGVAEMILKIIKQELKAHPIAWASIPFLWPVLRDLKKNFDYTEAGGAPLLGVNGVCIIAHGSSNAKAIKNALVVASRTVERNVNEHILNEISKYKDI